MPELPPMCQAEGGDYVCRKAEVKEGYRLLVFASPEDGLMLFDSVDAGHAYSMGQRELCSWKEVGRNTWTETDGVEYTLIATDTWSGEKCEKICTAAVPSCIATKSTAVPVGFNYTHGVPRIIASAGNFSTQERSWARRRYVKAILVMWRQGISFNRRSTTSAPTRVDSLSSADALNRLKTMSAANAVTIAFTYDAGANAKGRLTGMVDESGTTTRTYNAQGRIETVVRVFGGISFKVRYDYDAAGNLKTLTYPSGKTVTYTYEKERVSAVSVGATTLLSQSEIHAIRGGALMALGEWASTRAQRISTVELRDILSERARRL
ncbi:hypothetical protein LP419_15940 [Massilia sp. H-1]|nr:hypothetical protein LP419_15940 [Massilia sp. H-1]